MNLTPSEKKHAIVNSDSEVDKFITEFIRMRTATKKGIKSPHKAVLLITILKLIGLKVITVNHIKFDDLLIVVFGRYWDKLVPKDTPFQKNVCHPFIHLSSDSFFHLNLKKRISDINANWTVDTVQAVCNYAYLDDRLFALAQVKESRLALINFLISHFELNNAFSSQDTSSLERPASSTNIVSKEPITRPLTKSSSKNNCFSSESFAQYLSGVKNKHGKPFSESSINVYVGATKGDYMKEVLLRFSDTDNLYSIDDIDTLNRVLAYLESVDFKGYSKTPLFALRLYIQFVKDQVSTKQINPDPVIHYWIKSNNVQDFRLDEWMQNHNSVPWRRTNNLEVGDIVFIYTSSPVQRLTYVFKVEELNVTPPAEMYLYWGEKRKADISPVQHDLLKLIHRIPSDLKLSLLDLQLHGVYGKLQGGRIISGHLLDYILGEIAKSGINANTLVNKQLQNESQESGQHKEDNRQYWLFSWNERDFRLHDYFREHQYIDWNNKHNNRLYVGDIVFLYCSLPESTIRYITKVTRIRVPVLESIDDHEYSLTPPRPRTYKYCTRLKLIRSVRSSKLDFHNLELNGLNCAIRSPLKANEQLLKYILSIIGDID